MGFNSGFKGLNR